MIQRSHFVAWLASLDPRGLRPLWKQLAWLPCPEVRWPGPARLRLDLCRSIAERDAAARKMWRQYGLDLYADGKFSPELVMLLTLR